ncbi:MAG: serine/threonine protein kinase [Planctomycetes bacterium]|nr:serine/threonine protein kinase [Planctomycetota bacterium]
MPRTFAQLPGYEIVSRIGRGAGAVIYEARERSSRRRVAVKHVVRRGPQDDRFVGQAETEYKVAHELDHPYLRRCHDIVRVRRWLKTHELFLIMELVDGQRLDNQYRDQRPERVEPVVEMFMHVAEGLRAMHRHGYIHADIKPNNILLTAGGGLKIIDFGQSCPVGHTKSRIQGTPDYIAPEQVLLAPLDQRTDVFNLGATMYWVLTGKAFSTVLPTAPAGLKKIELDARRGNEPPHQTNEQVPLPLSRLIMECCASDREQRPRDMSKVISRLETILVLLTRKSGSAARSETQR